jgi:hypothetical protein
MVLYQICVYGADLKSNMAARVHNVFSLAEILKIFLSETTKSIELWLGLVVSNEKIFKISTNQNTLWALAAMLDFRSVPKTKTADYAC